MDNIFQQALKHTLEFEGIFSNDQDDRGGKTKYGITENVARGYGYTGEMMNLPLDLVEQIYKKDYWNKLKLDQISIYSVAIALKVFDIAVNCGVHRASRWLQQAVNCLSHNTPLVVDGVIGDDTIVKIKTLRHHLDIITIVKMLNIYQGQHYIDICSKNETQKKFIKGWFRRIEI